MSPGPTSEIAVDEPENNPPAPGADRRAAGDASASPHTPGRRWTRRVAAGTLWIAATAVIAISVVWGRNYQREQPLINLGAAPLVGRDGLDGWEWRFNPSLVAALVVAALVVAAVGSSWSMRVRLRWVVVAASVGAGAFAALLALTDGGDGLTYGAAHETEYAANLELLPPGGEFVSTFVDRLDEHLDEPIDGYSVHVRGHPPGFVLVLKTLAWLGMTGTWPAVALSLLGAAATPAGVLVAVWAVAGERWVRLAAPFLVVAPYAIWMVTSADAVFAAVGAWGIAAGAVAVRATGRRATAAGAVSGLLLGSLLFLTYGGATFGLLAVAVVVAAVIVRMPGVWPAVAGAMLGAAAVVTAFAIAGFWWVDGALAVRDQYWAGTAKYRTWTYFGLANLAVALIAVGPATLRGLTLLRSRYIWVLVGGALLALAASHLSQYSRAEVERIWLLFYPFIAVAGAAIVARRGRTAAMGWLGVQALAAIVLQAALLTKW